MRVHQPNSFTSFFRLYSSLFIFYGYYCTNFIINKNKSLYLGENLRVDALLSDWAAAAAEQSSGNDNDDTDSAHSINELSS